jgi:hypothetical protein
MKYLKEFDKFSILEINQTPDSDFKSSQNKTKLVKNPMEDQTRAIASTTARSGGDPELSKPYKKTLSLESSDMDWDNLVDIVSLAIEGVPGIGTVVSAGIDLTHGLSYVIRWFTTKEEDEKIEYGLMATITLISCLIPGVGNASNIIARGGIKKILKQTPDSIITLAREAGILEKPIIDLVKKSRWQYSIALFLGRYVSYQYLQNLTNFLNKLTNLKSKDNLLNTAIKKIISDIESTQEYLKFTCELGKKSGGKL